MEFEKIKFNNVKEMVCWLIDNEGKSLHDGYGRKWKFEKWGFYYKDISQSEYQDGLQCTHLFGTDMFTGKE